MATFIPGLELSRRYFHEAVEPILRSVAPGLRYAAGLIGPGSDVLGFDSERSTDHGWGPRLQLFFEPSDHPKSASSIDAALAAHLPASFAGYSTNYAFDGGPAMRPATPGEIHHWIEIHTVHGFLKGALGIEGLQLAAADWLLMPQQALLETTAGAIFRDDVGDLTKAREILKWYPREVWILVLAAQWKRIGQEEPFVGRCAEAGDELGSRIIASRLVRDLMRLCFLIERRYAPYSKWLGSAFARLSCATKLGPIFESITTANGHPTREQYLCKAYETVAEMHNALGITPQLDPATRSFHDRPYHVLGADRFAESLVKEIKDQEVGAIIKAAGLIGAIDQFADSTDLTDRADLCMRLRALLKTH